MGKYLPFLSMSLCINPNCPHTENPDNRLFCHSCDSELLLAGRYRVLRLLSNKGGFGHTYEVIHNTIPKVLKILIQNFPKAVELFEQEARVLTLLLQSRQLYTLFPLPRRQGYLLSQRKKYR